MNINPLGPNNQVSLNGKPAQVVKGEEEAPLFGITPDSPDVEPEAEVAAKGIGYKDALIKARDKNGDGKVDFQEIGGVGGAIGTWCRWLFAGRIEKKPK